MWAAWKCGHSKWWFSFLVFFQIQSWKHQFFPSGWFHIWDFFNICYICFIIFISITLHLTLLHTWICFASLNTTATVWMIPFGLSGAIRLVLLMKFTQACMCQTFCSLLNLLFEKFLSLSILAWFLQHSCVKWTWSWSPMDCKFSSSCCLSNSHYWGHLNGNRDDTCTQHLGLCI